MTLSGPFTAWMQTIPILEIPAIWILYSGNCFFFAAMIVVFGLQRGAVSNALSHKTLVWLGELSYAIYILHFPIMVWFLDHLNVLKLSPQMVSAAFVLSLLLISHVFFTYIEKPLRNFILGKGSRRPAVPAVAAVK
jgi:peptidoglycan/LPS O-acetylase OafA/YrhL